MNPVAYVVCCAGRLAWLLAGGAPGLRGRSRRHEGEALAFLRSRCLRSPAFSPTSSSTSSRPPVAPQATGGRSPAACRRPGPSSAARSPRAALPTPARHPDPRERRRRPPAGRRARPSPRARPGYRGGRRDARAQQSGVCSDDLSVGAVLVLVCHQNWRLNTLPLLPLPKAVFVGRPASGTKAKDSRGRGWAPVLLHA